MDSSQMVKEAYAAIAAIHTVTAPRVTEEVRPWGSSIIAVEQLYQANMITRTEYLEQLEGLSDYGR